MHFDQKDVHRFVTLLQDAEIVRCICHRSPDGDAIGSLLGMGLLLERHFPTLKISFHCEDLIPDIFHFLPSSSRVEGVPHLQKNDVVIFLDCAEPKRTDMHESCPALFDGSHQTVSIDHHPTDSPFAGLNFIVPHASSTCEIIVHLAKQLSWELSSDIATCLLTGVYTDTGGLLHSNTTQDVYRTVASLLRAGASHQKVVKEVFRTAKLSTLKLWGRVLEKIVLTEEGGAISAVTQGDFKAADANHTELADAIDYVNAIPGMRFSLILSERDGKVKGSLRTLRDDVDVSAMAGKFGGGGHRKAAGFAVPGKLKPEVRWKVVEEDD